MPLPARSASSGAEFPTADGTGSVPIEEPLVVVSAEQALAAALPTGTPPVPVAASVSMVDGCGVPCGSSDPHGGVLLSLVSDDPTYGYAQSHPIPVGDLGGYDEMVYLMGLFGPNGETVSFERIGSCCPLEGLGMLDMIRLTYDGLDRPVVIFLNPYASATLDEPLRAPMGFRGAATGYAPPAH